MRQSARRNQQNRAVRSALKTAIKKVRNAPAETAEAVYRAAERLLDRAAQRGLVHGNAAARSKRRLRKAVNARA